MMMMLLYKNDLLLMTFDWLLWLMMIDNGRGWLWVMMVIDDN